MDKVGQGIKDQLSTPAGCGEAYTYVAGALVAKKIGQVCRTSGSAPALAKSADKWSRAPKSTMDKMVLEAAKKGKGQKLIDNLTDPQFKGMEKWSYGETSANGLRSEVHYVRDPQTGALMDFKFKHHAELYR